MNKVSLLLLSILLLAAVTVLSGCGKLQEASQAVKSVSKTVEAARDMAKSAESMEKAGDLDQSTPLTEREVRLYYGEIARLKQDYPEIEFQSPVTAALQATMAGKDLEKIITRETDLDFDQYTRISTRLLLVMTGGAAAGMSDEIVAAMEQGVTEMEAYDTSEMNDEQRQTFQTQLAEQKQALEEARAAAADPEVQGRKEEFEMVMRIREEFGL